MVGADGDGRVVVADAQIGLWLNGKGGAVAGGECGSAQSGQRVVRSRGERERDGGVAVIGNCDRLCAWRGIAFHGAAEREAGRIGGDGIRGGLYGELHIKGLCSNGIS